MNPASILLHLALGLLRGSPMGFLYLARLFKSSRRAGSGRILLSAFTQLSTWGPIRRRSQPAETSRPKFTTACVQMRMIPWMMKTNIMHCKLDTMGKSMSGPQ